jgi:hypothetical protein
MLDKQDLNEDTKDIKLIDKQDSSKCCSYILECLFIICC